MDTSFCERDMERKLREERRSKRKEAEDEEDFGFDIKPEVGENSLQRLFFPLN